MMLCYMDKTFCPYYRNCADGKDCHRALTDKVQEAAVRWWRDATGKKSGPPVCRFGEKPQCWASKRKPKKKINKITAKSKSYKDVEFTYYLDGKGRKIVAIKDITGSIVALTGSKAKALSKFIIKNLGG